MSPNLLRIVLGVLAGVLLCTAGCSGVWWKGAEGSGKGHTRLAGGHGVNGGWTCAVCVVAVSLAEQKAEIQNQTIVRALQTICSFLPDDFQTNCYSFLKTATPVLIKMAEERFTPDVTCHLLNLCHTDPGQATCSLYPTPSAGMERTVEKIRRTLPKVYQAEERLGFDVCSGLPILKEICEKYMNGFQKYHLPLVDFDSDNFSGVAKTLRGSYWKGKDCSDINPSIRPGTKTVNQDEFVDSDCNGIYGTDSTSGKPYEELLCSQTQHMGVGILGDSAGAHMHIPKEWFTASQIGPAAFKDVAMIVANEMDWPMTSTVTGARLIDPENKQGLSRDPELDQPMLLVFSMIGNDVCNWYNDTVEHMTSDEQMKAGFIETLDFIIKVVPDNPKAGPRFVRHRNKYCMQSGFQDTKLPKGSHVITTGLIDGRILYDTLHDRVHPLGEWRQDLRYPDVYNFLSCLSVSPCNGWMSSNETLRNVTSERAANLSRVIESLSASYRPKNFDIHYYDLPLQAVIEMWKKQGGETWQLIEPVDGFHPNQIGMSLFAEYFWELIVKDWPDAVKTWTNPNNARIRALFGDQGGY